MRTEILARLGDLGFIPVITIHDAAHTPEAGGGTIIMVGGVVLQIPLLSKEGQARSAGVVCSKMRSHLIDAREALLITRYFRL